MAQGGEGGQAGALGSLGHILTVWRGRAGHIRGSQALSSWELSKLESLGRHDQRGLGLRNQELETLFFRSQGWGT